jgi:hypothetical protein
LPIHPPSRRHQGTFRGQFMNRSSGGWSSPRLAMVAASFANSGTEGGGFSGHPRWPGGHREGSGRSTTR